MREEPLLWFDIETTGLDPEAPNARILAVGLIVTEHQLVIEGGIDWIVGPCPTEDEIASWDPFVQAMHTKSGLLHMLKTTTRLPDIDEVAMQAAEWVFERFPMGNVMPAGSSLHFDRKWADKFMPALTRQFHYRQADVSALKEFCQRWLPGCSDEDIKAAGVGKRDIHLPHPDIIDSIGLAAFLRGRMERGFYGSPDLGGADFDLPQL